MAKFNIGDNVRLTGEFLKNTGQQSGGEGLAVWKVLNCNCELCKSGNFICTNQENTNFPAFYTKEEIKNNPDLKWRHIHVGNLEKCRKHINC